MKGIPVHLGLIVIVIVLALPKAVVSFVTRTRAARTKTCSSSPYQAIAWAHVNPPHQPPLLPLPSTALKMSQQQTIAVDTTLNDERATALFAWISRAFAGDDDRYNNLMLAVAAIFGTNLPQDSQLKSMLREAISLLPSDEEACVGDSISLADREMSSLGAMGAGQWLGQFQTRPHALLCLADFGSTDDWIQTLPRGVKRTLKKAVAQNFTVTPKPIEGGRPAPHSSLAHFRCVLEHEVRLLASADDADDTEGFLDALGAAVARYVETTRMAGEIQEYRCPAGKVIAFSHEVRKGKTVRGQWFYATNQAAKNYVWFHSVHELVKRAIEMEGVTVVDLGPSGSDAFSELKEKYGFRSVDDWPAVADYIGPFWYEGEKSVGGLGIMLDQMEGTL
jgi:hypothetical protein